MKKLLAIGTAFLLAAAMLASCGAALYTDNSVTAAASSVSQKENIATGGAGERADAAYYEDGAVYDVEEEAIYDEDIDDIPEEAMPESGTGLTGGYEEEYGEGEYERKIIVAYTLQLQTKGFDQGVEALQQLTESYGGYTESSYVDGKNLYDEYGSRYASFTMRVPSEKLEQFVAEVSAQFNLVNKQQTSTDITVQYYDVESRLKVLIVQEERLVAMLEQAADLDYLLGVERELSNVRAEIESLNSSLKWMKNSVSMSTIYINLEEVVEYEEIKNEPTNFIQRIKDTLKNSGKNFVRQWENNFLVLIMLAPNLVILALIAVILAVIVRSRKKAKLRKSKAVQEAAGGEEASLLEKKPDENTDDIPPEEKSE